MAALRAFSKGVLLAALIGFTVLAVQNPNLLSDMGDPIRDSFENTRVLIGLAFLAVAVATVAVGSVRSVLARAH